LQKPQSLPQTRTDNLPKPTSLGKLELKGDRWVLVREKPVTNFRIFEGDKAIEHFTKHGSSIMKSLGRKSYNLKNYVSDANHVLRTGTYVKELNGYVRLIGGPGSAKYGFVGLNRTTGQITTFHIKTASWLAKKAPSLGIQY
jgi:filamentous hemagglutinin